MTGRFESVDPLVRFWSYVLRGDDCWEWIGAHCRGYGRFWDGEREVRAHRFSYALHVGDIPAGLMVLHRCDNPPCVNPAHLFVGTNDDNMADKKVKGRNAYGDRNGSRTCPHRRPSGEGSPVAKLNDAEARIIRDAYLIDGQSQTQLARLCGVSQSSISQVVRAEGRFQWLSQP